MYSVDIFYRILQEKQIMQYCHNLCNLEFYTQESLFVILVTKHVLPRRMTLGGKTQGNSRPQCKAILIIPQLPLA